MKTNLKLVPSTHKKGPKVMNQKPRKALPERFDGREHTPHDKMLVAVRRSREKMVKPSETLQALMDGICNFPDEMFNEEIQDIVQNAWAKLEELQLELDYAGL